jgi:hypothetical protein
MEENNILDASTLTDERSINSNITNNNETSPLFRQNTNSSLFQNNIQVSTSNEPVNY